MSVPAAVTRRSVLPAFARRECWRLGLVAAAALVGLVIVASVASPWLTDYSPLDQDLLQRNAGPGGDHLLGTDHLGRDIFARLLYGARITLAIAFAGTVIAFAAGAGLGLLALAFGRISETLAFGLIDLVRALPGMLLALLLIVALGSGVGPLTIALGISFAPLVAYVTRAAYHREMSQEYVLAAKSFSGGRLHIVRRHVLPNIVGALITQFAIILPRCIVTESVLSFLGVGSSPDAPTWGRMIADSTRFIERAPHAILCPVVVLVLVTLSLSIIGNDLRQRFDPMRRQVSTLGAPSDSDSAASDHPTTRGEP